MYSYKYCNLHNNVQARKCQARNPWWVSVLLVQLRWMGAAGGWNDAVLAQVKEHLPVVIGGVPNNHGGQAEARVRPGIGPFDGIEHVLGADGAERFADRGERIAQVNQQFFFGFRGAGAAFVTGFGGFCPSNSAANPKLLQATCLTCSANVRTSAGPNSGFSLLNFPSAGR